MQLEHTSLDRAGAAAVVGITEPQIANWITKYGLFPEKRQGRGAHFYFLIWDVVALAAIKALLDTGFAAPAAVEAIRPYSPYAALFDGYAAGPNAYPGIFRLAQNHEGRWVGFDGDDVKVSLQIRMWPIFDEIFPRFCEQVVDYAKAVPPEVMRQAIDQYRAEMEDLRNKQSGKNPSVDI